jgi:two-component system chemotaxis sensor kinase CheA
MTDINAIDLKRFNVVFFDECAEHLVEMEQIVLSLQDAVPDDEQLNAIFRAAHSIKGGAGIFGFDDMAVVTHVLESLLDRLRNHEIQFTTAMIDLFLEAGDVIAMQLAGHRDGAEVNPEAADRIRGKLQELNNENNESGISPTADPSAETSSPAAAFTAESREQVEQPRSYQLLFTPDSDLFKRGTRLENLFAELAELGELTIRAELSELPALGCFDPEECVTRWNFTLVTTASENDIRDVFVFVADDAQLLLKETANKPMMVTAAPLPQQPSESEDDRILNSMGRRAFDQNELTPGAYGRRGGEADSSIRVNVTKVDQLINQIGELVITQAMLAQAAGALDPVIHESLHRSVLQLENNTRDLQESVMSIRLVPISIVFSRFPRMVRELAGKLGKQVDLKTVGDTTELDKGLIEKVADPLTHLVRNSLDHGLETAAVRTSAGKEPTGTLTLRASQVGGRIDIDVIDDGAGLNREKILAKAAERGIVCAETMADEEVWQLIFAPGFSTAEAVTEVSGRGVGMDVVLKNVQSIGGRVHLTSNPGQGMKVTISLPLTLAILDGLSVAVGGEKFIIPLNIVIESLQPHSDNIKTINGMQVIHVRGEYIQIIPLHELFHLETSVTRPESGILVLVDVEGEKAAILVDALLDQQQVVIKSIETNYRKVEGSAGATILGDGRVALILDVTALFQMRKRKAQLYTKK